MALVAEVKRTRWIDDDIIASGCSQVLVAATPNSPPKYVLLPTIVNLNLTYECYSPSARTNQAEDSQTSFLQNLLNTQTQHPQQLSTVPRNPIDSFQGSPVSFEEDESFRFGLEIRDFGLGLQHAQVSQQSPHHTDDSTSIHHNSPFLSSNALPKPSQVFQPASPLRRRGKKQGQVTTLPDQVTCLTFPCDSLHAACLIAPTKTDGD